MSLWLRASAKYCKWKCSKDNIMVLQELARNLVFPCFFLKELKGNRGVNTHFFLPENDLIKKLYYLRIRYFLNSELRRPSGVSEYEFQVERVFYLRIVEIVHSSFTKCQV